MARRQLPLLSPGLVGALAFGGALLVGVLMARGLGPGIGATVALLYAPVVLLNLPLGIVGWVPITFIRYLPFVWVGPTAASTLLFLAWLGTLRNPMVGRRLALRHSRLLVVALPLFLIWLALSLAWAQKVSLGVSDLLTWLTAAAVFAVIVTTITRPRQVRMVAAAFVLGAAVSVVIGLLFSGVASSGQSAIATAAADEGRLTGGAGDPNYLAAGLVPAIVLAGGLMAGTRNAIARWALLVAAALCGVGLAATESRGGFLAAAAAALAAVVVFRHRRAYVAGFLAIIVTLMAVWFASSPSAFQRVTNLNGGGNGRTDLWHVAWVIGQEHPAQGVGLGNFVVQEQKYVRRPGPITAVALIVDQPHVAHNVYLQLFAEDGVPGVALLVAVLLLFVRSAIRAGHLFERDGKWDLATLARAVAVGQVSTWVAFFFISDGPDERIWVLYALGPVLLGLAARPALSSGHPLAAGRDAAHAARPQSIAGGPTA